MLNGLFTLAVVLNGHWGFLSLRTARSLSTDLLLNNSLTLISIPLFTTMASGYVVGNHGIMAKAEMRTCIVF